MQSFPASAHQVSFTWLKTPLVSVASCPAKHGTGWSSRQRFPFCEGKCLSSAKSALCHYENPQLMKSMTGRREVQPQLHSDPGLTMQALATGLGFCSQPKQTAVMHSLGNHYRSMGGLAAWKTHKFETNTLPISKLMPHDKPASLKAKTTNQITSAPKWTHSMTWSNPPLPVVWSTLCKSTSTSQLQRGHRASSA